LKPRQVELITIGDELLLGFTVDTNAAHISRTLAANGIEVVAEAWKHDLDGLVDAIVSTLGNQERAATVRGG
jgi:nicotinamide-nucleotide amidase